MNSIDTWISTHARFTPSAVAIEFEGIVWSYRDFSDQIDQCTTAFISSGISAGSRVVWVGQNHPQMLTALFACARIGALLVPINWRLSIAEMQYVIDDALPSLMLSDAPMRSTADALAAVNPACPRIDVDTSEWNGKSLSATVALRPSTQISSAAPLLIVYTSGTTGRPKGAVLDQHAIQVNAWNSIHMHGLGCKDKVLSVLPLFHVGGLNILTTPALYTGAHVILHRRFDPGATLASLQTDRPSLSVLVPATIQAVAAHDNWCNSDLSSLRMLTTGSSIVATETLSIFESRGIPVVQVYGCTETCPVSAYQRPDDNRHLPGATGRAALHSEIRIHAEDGSVLNAGSSGEIVVTGDHILSSYWNNAEATDTALRYGGFATGDIGFLDKEGNLFVQDRAKDLIISGGENVYPAEIERVLISVEGVIDVAVTGTGDATWGQVPVAWLIVDDTRFSLDKAKQTLASELARFKHPRDWRIVEDFPRSALGKIQKFELRQQKPTS